MRKNHMHRREHLRRNYLVHQRGEMNRLRTVKRIQKKSTNQSQNMVSNSLYGKGLKVVCFFSGPHQMPFGFLWYIWKRVKACILF